MTDKIVDREKVSPTNVVNLPDTIAPEDFPEVLEQTMVEFSNGDIIEGIVVSVTRNEIMVDVGYKSEGIIPSRELSVQKDYKNALPWFETTNVTIDGKLPTNDVLNTEWGNAYYFIY